MAYCAPKGIPHSHFLKWDPHDQDKALAWDTYERSRCPACGTFPDEWLDERGELVEPPPYRSTTVRCFGCVTLEETKKEVPSEDRSSVHVFLVKWKGRVSEWRMRSSPLV